MIRLDTIQKLSTFLHLLFYKHDDGDDNEFFRSLTTVRVIDNSDPNQTPDNHQPRTKIIVTMIITIIMTSIIILIN